jgi:hypothetical protein
MKTTDVSKIVVVLIATLFLLSSLAVSGVVVSAASSQPQQIVNVTAHVINDEDSGACGYWAIDNYNKLVSITSEGNDIYLVNESYHGFSSTYAGAVSPGSSSCSSDQTTNEGMNASLTFQGTLSFYIRGTFAPTPQTYGFIGTFNFEGTVSDILLGTYSNGQTGPTSVTDMVGLYFPGYTVVNSMPSPFYFIYHYQGQTWIDSASGLFGNIVT